MDNFFKELPWQFKAMWAFGIVISTSILLFSGWVVIKVMMYFGVI